MRNVYLGKENLKDQPVIDSLERKTEYATSIVTEQPATIKEVIPSTEDGEATAEALEMARKARIAAAEAVKKAQQPPPPSPPKAAPIVEKTLSELQARNAAKTPEPLKKQSNLTELLKSTLSPKNEVAPNLNAPTGGSLKDLVSGSGKATAPKVESPKPRSSLKDLVQANATPKNAVIPNAQVPKGRSLKDIISANAQTSKSAFPPRSFAKPSPANSSESTGETVKQPVSSGVEPTKPSAPYFFAHVPDEKEDIAWTKMESSKPAPSNDSIPLESSKGERSFDKFAAAAEAFKGSGVGAVA